MSKFKLCWWEDNGYHDSYFHGVSFDDATGQLCAENLGATAYAGGIGFDDTFLVPTPEVVEKARVLLAEIIFNVIKAAELRDVLTPGTHNVKLGREFRLLVPHSAYAKNGSAFAIDPATGKRIKRTFPAGHVFKSRSDEAAFFGTTYRTGYNKPNRFNSSISTSYTDEKGIRFIRVPLEKFRQHAEPMPDAELRTRAEELSHNLKFGAAFGCKAWETENWAQKISEKKLASV